MSRKKPTLTDMLAATLRELLEIPYEHAKVMSAEQIISLVQFDHIHHHALNKHEPWVDDHWNLDPLLIGGHRIKTRTIDVPVIAKTKRITTEQEAFRKLLLTPRDERPEKKSRWGTRKFQQRRKPQ